MSLKKAEIVEKVTGQLGFSRRQAAGAVESLLETVKAPLAAGEDVLISGFGKFCVKGKAQRKGRNPATGEDAILTARRADSSPNPISAKKDLTGNRTRHCPIAWTRRSFPFSVTGMP